MPDAIAQDEQQIVAHVCRDHGGKYWVRPGALADCTEHLHPPEVREFTVETLRREVEDLELKVRERSQFLGVRGRVRKNEKLACVVDVGPADWPLGTLVIVRKERKDA